MLFLASQTSFLALEIILKYLENKKTRFEFLQLLVKNIHFAFSKKNILLHPLNAKRIFDNEHPKR